MKNLVKIKEYKGIYFIDKDKKLEDIKEISLVELQRRLTIPYELAIRYYEGKKSSYEIFPILNNTQTLKKNCELIALQRINGKFAKKFKIKEPKLNEVFEEWISMRKNTISKKHYEVTIFSYNAHIKDIIGNIKIKQVKLKDMQNIVNKMIDQGKSPRTTKTIKDILSPVFEFAIKNDYIEKNIAREIEIQKFDNKRYFTIDDEDRNALYKAIINYENLMIRAMFIFLLHGRRKSEVLTLKWDNIDFANKIYFLPSSQNKSRKNLQFPLSSLQIEALKSIGVKNKGYIFIKEDGNPYKDIRWHWDKINQKLKTPIRLHDLRHLIGYIGINMGISLEAIGETLGHSNIGVTKRYANIKNETINNTLNAIFSNFKTEKH